MFLLEKSKSSELERELPKLTFDTVSSKYSRSDKIHNKNILHPYNGIEDEDSESADYEQSGSNSVTATYLSSSTIINLNDTTLIFDLNDPDDVRPINE